MYEEVIRDFFLDMSQELKEQGFFILDNLHKKFGNYPSVVDEVVFESDEEDEYEVSEETVLLKK